MVVGAFLVYAFTATFTTEYTSKRELRSFVRKGMPVHEFTGKYKNPKFTYKGWRSLPDEYQRLFGTPSESEDLYYSYPVESLPRYWAFVVSVDTDTDTIQRYVICKAGPLPPRKTLINFRRPRETPVS